ncbi:hypothetical protein CASFOL_026200 [Castilleja foliolosa]|uniref:Uncharacterized protein n=1 Tax=Castilleja foliolosa TaxID=1961234 RepID=A0ABD3CIY8_9LAMI
MCDKSALITVKEILRTFVSVSAPWMRMIQRICNRASGVEMWRFHKIEFEFGLDSQTSWMLFGAIISETLLGRYIDGLADAVEQGLEKIVGVSNYSGVVSAKWNIADAQEKHEYKNCPLRWQDKHLMVFNIKEPYSINDIDNLREHWAVCFMEVE